MTVDISHRMVEIFLIHRKTQKRNEWAMRSTHRKSAAEIYKSARLCVSSPGFSALHTACAVTFYPICRLFKPEYSFLIRLGVITYYLQACLADRFLERHCYARTDVANLKANRLLSTRHIQQNFQLSDDDFSFFLCSIRIVFHLKCFRLEKSPYFPSPFTGKNVIQQTFRLH